jgi:hypothetical protein
MNHQLSNWTLIRSEYCHVFVTRHKVWIGYGFIEHL